MTAGCGLSMAVAVLDSDRYARWAIDGEVDLSACKLDCWVPMDNPMKWREVLVDKACFTNILRAWHENYLLRLLCYFNLVPKLA